MPTRKNICLWSGPRNVSTALMYSFAQRQDTVVVDEPLYAHYLYHSGAEHPGADEVIAHYNRDGQQVMDELLHSAREPDPPLLFMKHMAHHLIELDRTFLTETINVLLIRDPRDMLPSLSVQIPNAILRDTGLKKQTRLLTELKRLGQKPLVLDSRELLTDPASVLQTLCERLDIVYDPAMLHWTPGARAEDGIWAKHWYQAVHKSSGFQAYQPKTAFPTELKGLLRVCEPLYNELYAHAIRA